MNNPTFQENWSCKKGFTLWNQTWFYMDISNVEEQLTSLNMEKLNVYNPVAKQIKICATKTFH